MEEVDVLGGHLQRPVSPVASNARIGPPDADHVGPQIGQHHSGVRTRPDASEFDHLDAGQGSAAHPFLTLMTCLRSPSVADSRPPFMARLSTNPGMGTDGSMVMSNLTLVFVPSGVSV